MTESVRHVSNIDMIFMIDGSVKSSLDLLAESIDTPETLLSFLFKGTGRARIQAVNRFEIFFQLPSSLEHFLKIEV